MFEEQFKTNNMTTTEKIDYLVKQLELKGCPPSELYPYAMQILTDCDKNNTSVKNVELIFKNKK